jgi:hypothetical protein
LRNVVLRNFLTISPRSSVGTILSPVEWVLPASVSLASVLHRSGFDSTRYGFVYATHATGWQCGQPIQSSYCAPVFDGLLHMYTVHTIRRDTVQASHLCSQIRDERRGRSQRKTISVRVWKETFAPLRNFDRLLLVLRAVTHVSSC